MHEINPIKKATQRGNGGIESKLLDPYCSRHDTLHITYATCITKTTLCSTD